MSNGIQDPPPQPPKQRGCFFYGCLILVIMIIVIGGSVGYGAYKLYKKAYDLTDEKPMAMPQLNLTDQEITQATQKVEKFRDKLNNNQADHPLVLNPRELNALFSKDPQLKGKINISIEENKIKGKVCLPLDKLAGFKGRYLNATANFKVSLEGGVLIVVMDDATVKGKPLPDWLMEQFRKENLAKDAYKNPKNAEMIRKFKSIAVKDGQLLLIPRALAEKNNDAAKNKVETPVKKDETKDKVKNEKPEKTEKTEKTEKKDDTKVEEVKEQK